MRHLIKKILKFIKLFTGGIHLLSNFMFYGSNIVHYTLIPKNIAYDSVLIIEYEW